MGDQLLPNKSEPPHDSQSLPLNFLRHTIDRIRNPLNNLIDLRDNFVIPKPNHRISGLTQKLTSRLIALRLLRMLRTIKLNDQLRFEANKIPEKRPDRILPTKFESFHLMSPQTRP